MSLRERLEQLRGQGGAEPVARTGPPRQPVAAGARETGPPRTCGGTEGPAASDRVEQPDASGGVERGGASVPVVGPSAISVAERLRRLHGAGPASAARPRPLPRPPRPVRADAAALAELLEGEILAPGVIVTERRLRLSGRHGQVALRRAADPVHGLPEGDFDPRGLVFFDTETTGLSGGTGTVAFLLGLGRVLGDALVVRQYLLTAFSGEADLLAAAGEWAEDARGVVTFNGKSFDVPLVATRCRMAGVADRFSALRHVDLLPPTRRAFARRWSDCRLGTAERRLLRFERENDLPGSEAPESWFAFVRGGDAERLPQVAWHNHWDVVSLAALLPALADVHADPGAWQADVLAVARAHARAGGEARAFHLLRTHRALLEGDGLLELAACHRRRAQWCEAQGLWETLAAEGHVEAVECLAKYHEHVCRDFAAALVHAERLPGGPERERRCARLRQKLGRAACARGW